MGIGRSASGHPVDFVLVASQPFRPRSDPALATQLSFTGLLSALEFFPEQLVVPAQAQAIWFVQHKPTKQFEKLFRVFRLLIQGVERAAHDLARGLRVERQPFSVERLFFPAVIDAGENVVPPMPRHDLNENAPAIAVEVGTIEFDVGVFVRWQAGLWRNARHIAEVDATDLALGEVREDGVERDHV